MKNSFVLNILYFFSKPYWFYGSVFVLVVLAGCLLYYDMRFGPWAFSDSAEYIISARNLVEGYGLGIHGPNGNFMPLSLHPPFYSIILAPFAALNVDIFVMIKWLNILLFTGSVFLLTYGGYKITKSALFSLSIGLIFLVSPAMLNNFNGAMTEPLFIFLSIANLIFLNLSIKNKSKWFFWLAVFTASFATLTRYIGFASILTGFLFLFLFTDSSWKKRFVIAFLYSISAGILLLIWFVYLDGNSGAMASRSFDLGKGIIEAFTVNRIALTEVLAKWLPFRISWFPSWKSKIFTIYSTFLITAFLLLFLIISCWKKKDKLFANPLFLILSAGFYCVSYFSFLVISFFSSLPPDLNERMFSPLLIFIYILIFGSLFFVIKSFKLPQIINLIPIALLLIISISYWQQTRSIALDRHKFAYSYSSPTWKNSNLINEIKNSSRKTALYSNHPVGILLHTGLFPYEISGLQQVTVNTNNTQHLTMALFYPISDEDQLIIDDFFSSEADMRFDLVAKKEFSDGIIYQFAANEKN
jgi:hypothetical protein